MDALPLLAALGILVGFSAGAAILLFRFLIETILGLFLDGNSENFESLSLMFRAAIPITGAVILGMVFRSLAANERRTGIGFVVERFHLYQGAITLRSLTIQFFGAAIALISGFPMGREGPAVHLGAASGSLLGQWARLPNNSLRLLTSCGCAAAISASFNTPIAGVIFAIEVVMMEYHFNTVIPVILASVVGAILTRAMYGSEPAFSIPPVHDFTLLELPFVVLCGFATALVATSTIVLAKQWAIRCKSINVSWRFFAAGLITALCGVIAPEILGIGYDTVDAIMAGQLTLASIFLVLLVKLFASSACVGLGIPAGVIGPALVLGALTGGLLHLVLQDLLPESNATLYILLGMGGMMAAVLQAPLAALMALLELTFEAEIIFPGMLVVVIATMVTSQVFRQRSIITTLMELQGINLKISPLSAHLNRVGVAAVMDRNVKRVANELSVDDANKLLATNPQWLLLEQNGQVSDYMPASDLVNFINEQQQQKKEAEATPNPELKPVTKVNLKEIPSKRDNLVPILLSATLQEALELMTQKNVDALCVQRLTAPGIYHVFGVIRRQSIEHYYQR